MDGTRPLVIDVDATLVTAHSEKEQAAPWADLLTAAITTLRALPKPG